MMHRTTQAAASHDAKKRKARKRTGAREHRSTLKDAESNQNFARAEKDGEVQNVEVRHEKSTRYDSRPHCGHQYWR